MDYNGSQKRPRRGREGGSAVLDFRYDTFLDLCETRNYSRTAENLGLSQPTVIQHIQHLERHYGTDRFLYRNKQLYLTEKGEELCRQVRRIRGMIRRAERQMAAPAGRRTLRVGATKTIGEFVLPAAVDAYLRQDPEGDIDLYVDNTRALLGRLNAGVLDFAYLEGFFDKGAYAHRLLRRESFLGVCAPDSPLLGRRLALEDLLDQRLIIREPGSGTREILEKMLQQFSYGVDSFRHVSQISSFGALKALVAAGEGITFLYRPAAGKELAAGTLRELDIEGFPLRREFNFVMPEGIEPEERYLAFHSFCRDFLAGTAE